jgi:hypothetical protein
MERDLTDFVDAAIAGGPWIVAGLSIAAIIMWALGIR